MSFSIRSRKLSEKTDDPFVVNSQELIDKKLEKDGVLKKESAWSSLMNDRVRVGVLATLSYYLRTMKLGYPSFAIASELELTRQVNWYMAGKFFIGQYPPLVGLVYSSLARLVGYYGSEELHYADQPFYEFPLVALRRLSALLGASLIPLSYYTMRYLGHSRSAATMAAGLIMLENGLVTQSRFATPDIFVLFFGALASYSWTVMHKYSLESKSLLNTQSLTWQLATGVSLGCAMSSKWTGALSVPIVWVFVAGEMWNRLCERRNKVKDTLKRLSLYGFTMLLLPCLVYFTIFHFHLSMVPNAGDHDLLVSPKLKYSLVGHQAEPSQPNIAYGSQVVLRHEGTVGGYLHSHNKRFSGGSTQQEVTVYPHEDINNIWTIHKTESLYNASEPIEFVRNKAQIRLEHFATTRKLHSHDHRPQLTSKKEHSEVTAYGDKYIQDSHDYWILEILDENNIPSKNKNITWKALESRFRLMHVRGCHLVSRNVFHPPENQQEVTCFVSAASHVSTWVVESAYHEQLEKITHVVYPKMTKYEMMKEVHKHMWNYPSIVYSRLKPASVSDGAVNLRGGAYEENANRWFFKRVGMRLWSKLSGFSGHLVLNSIVQRLTIISMVIYPGFFAVNAFLSKRQIKLPQYLSWLNLTGLDVIINDFYTKSILFFYPAVLVHIGLLRFLPAHNLNMSDILGAMYYGSGLIAVTAEACTSRLPALWHRVLIYGTLVLALFKFSGLSHLAYGGEMWYRRDCESSSIDIDCFKFPPHAAELAEMRENSGSTTNSTQTTIYVDLPGNSQPYRYFHGQEAEADGHIAALKHSAFLKEAYAAKGELRYHRVLPTPPISPEFAAQQAKDITDQAIARKIEDDRKKEEEKQKEEREKAVKEALDNQENKNAQVDTKEQQQQQEVPAEKREQVDAIKDAAKKLKNKNKKVAKAA